MDFNNMQLLKDNSFNELNNMPVTVSGLCNTIAQVNELKYNNNAKDNSLDLYTIDNDRLHSSL